MKWEYWVTVLSAVGEMDSLNDLGQKGWELVSVILQGPYKIAYFKRPLRTKSENELLYQIDNRSSLV